MADLKYDILEKFGILSTSKSGWELQLNFVQWGQNTPKFDLRTWSPDNAKMGKGLTLTHDEIVALHDILGNILAVENQSNVAENVVDEPDFKNKIGRLGDF